MVKTFGREFRRSQGSVDVPVRVEIRSALIDRIKATVASSQVEEGGKLLGATVREGGSTLLRIETFLDSGPAVDKSTGHIMPDGEYQEALFRLLETWDPAIEHLGSWHSHHCNGLRSLSAGDVRGYIESVNDPRYRLPYFLVALVVGFAAGEILCKFYLFEKGRWEYMELPKGSVTSVSGRYMLADVLCEAERASVGVLRRKLRDTGASVGRPTEKIVGAESAVPVRTRGKPDESTGLSQLRKADDEWFRAHFDEVSVRRSQTTGRLAWIVQKRVGETRLVLRYVHPAGAADGTSHAEVEITLNGKQCARKESLRLDKNRFKRLENLITTAILESQQVGKSHKDNEERKPRPKGRTSLYDNKGRA